MIVDRPGRGKVEAPLRAHRGAAATRSSASRRTGSAPSASRRTPRATYTSSPLPARRTPRRTSPRSAAPSRGAASRSRLKDATRVRRDVWERAGEDSLRGVFLAMRAREVCRRAHGLRARARNRRRPPGASRRSTAGRRRSRCADKEADGQFRLPRGRNP